ncbi:MAG: nucleotidyltransferase family protein [Gemmatimonadales bacterium]
MPPPTSRFADRRGPDPRHMRLRESALRLLLDDPRLDLDGLDWAELRRVAERAGVIVRLADAVAHRHETVPAGFAAGAARACARTQCALALVDRLSEACDRLGIAHAFLKTVERYPDSGPDIDLLLADPSRSVDRLILRDVPAAVRGQGFRNRLSGSRTYTAAFGIVIDLHHARLGQLGEQARYARIVLSRARRVPLGATSCIAPSPEDHFLLIATQQVYTRPALRLADVYWAIGALRRHDELNWDYVFATALSMGMLPAVGAYLGYLHQMHRQLFDQPLLPESLRARFPADKQSRRDVQFPRAGVASRLYLDHVQASLEAGRWHSAARLFLLPIVAALRAEPRRSA